VSRRQAELVPDCLLDQDQNVAEYLAVLPSQDARVIASARSGKLCVMVYGWTRRLTVPAGATLMHALRQAQGDTMEACVHRMLHCSAVCNLVWTSFALRTFLQAELGSLGSDLVYSICLQNGTLIRPTSTRSVIGLQSHNLFRGVDLCRSETMEGGWVWS
jgi:hypothetical protein